MTLYADFLNRRCPALIAAFLILSGCAGVNNAILTNPSGQQHLTIAVFPVDNKSAVKAPLREIQQLIVKRLQSQGLVIIDEKEVNRTLDKHRVRYLGGLNASVSRALQEEAGTDAVLITSLESYNELAPPRIALLSRLVSTGPRPEILWSDSVGLAGDDAPGLLGLGLIYDPMVLSEKAVGVLTGSLAAFFSGKKIELEGGRKSYAPKIKFRSSSLGFDLLENDVNFVDRTSSGDERKGRARIAVALTSPGKAPVTVEYAAGSGTTATGKEYELRGNTLIFAPGETRKEIEIEVKYNAVYKDNKTVDLILESVKGAALGSTTMHTYTIMNTVPQPTASFASASLQVKKTDGPATMLVELSAISGKDVTVPFTVSGTAKTPGNYTITPSPVVIKAGTRNAVITVNVSDSGVNEDNKTVVVNMGVPVHATQGKITASTVTLVNTTPEPAVTFTTASQQVKETTGTVTIGMELSALSGRDVVVPYMVGGTARTPGNYTMTTGPVVIKAGTRSAAITVNVSDNGVNEDDKTVVVSMGMPTNAVQGKITTSTVTIVDADPAPKVSFRSGSSSGEETTSPVRLEVSLSSVSGKPVTVEYGVKGGTAVKGKDYAFLQADTLFFAPGETTKEIVVDIKSHGIYDDDKTFVVALKSPKNAVLGDTIAHTYTIIESGEPGQSQQSMGTAGDVNRPLLLAMAGTPGPLVLPTQIGTKKSERKGVPLPSIGFLYASSRGDEKVAAVRIPVGLSSASGKPVTVEYAVTGGTAVRGVNFTLKDGTLTFKPGETTKMIEITVRDNNVNEENKTVEVSLKNPRGAVPGTMTVFTYTIIDSDPPPTVSFSTSGQQVKETAGTVMIGAELSAVSGRDVTVPFMASSTAVNPLNYTITSAPLVIKAGRRSAAITVNVVHNGINEDDKTVAVCMGIPTDAMQGKITTSTVTIINTDPQPTVSFTTAGQQVKEGAGPVSIGAELSTVSGRDVTVPFMVSGTPAAQSNYSITPGPLVIKAGTRSAAITVTTSDNGVNEDDKTVVMTMGIPVNATQGKITTSTITIVVADPAPTVSFTKKDSSGDERASPARLEVGLSAAGGRTVQVEYAVTGGTAAQGKDYALPGNTLTFEPGETKKAVEIGIRNSGTYGENKTIDVALTKSINGELGIITKHTFTIFNTSPKPVVTFTIANQRIKRNIGRVFIPIRLSAVSGKDVIVPFTIGGSAVQGKDYAVTASPVAVPAGERDAVITIELKDGPPSEVDKTIELKLGNPDNALPGSSNYYRLVLVKDARPTIAVLPFFNTSRRSYAGEILMLHFVKELSKLTDFTVIEPGIVREQLLIMRVIMYEGISSPDIDLITDSVNADLIVTGKVFDYVDLEASLGKPRVNFTVMLISKTSKRVVWSSSSVNSGDDSLIVFSWGEVNTANAMVSEMIERVRKAMLSW